MNLSLTQVDPALSRRHLILRAGVAAAALGGLSACTNYGAQPATPPAGGASSGPTGAAGAGGPIRTVDIPVGGGMIITDTQTVVTQPTKGDFKAFSSICTHQQCPVTEVTTTINCPCHGSKFSITDGSVVNPPAPTSLAAKTVTVDGDTLTVS